MNSVECAFHMLHSPVVASCSIPSNFITTTEQYSVDFCNFIITVANLMKLTLVIHPKLFFFIQSSNFPRVGKPCPGTGSLHRGISCEAFSCTSQSCNSGNHRDNFNNSGLFDVSAVILERNPSVFTVLLTRHMRSL